LVGPKDNETEALVEKLHLSSVVRTIGRVNYEESIRHIRLATVCVLVEADCGEGIYLPSKLADYIVAKKPILALSPSVGVLADMVKHGGIIRASPNDEKSIAEAIGKLYKAFQNGRLHEYTPPEELPSYFEEGAVAKKFIAAVSKIRGKRIRNKSACQNASPIGTGDKY
jgi:glycosyltransferase involved in cell wall biosynthesis